LKLVRAIIGTIIAACSASAYSDDNEMPIASLDAYVDSLDSMFPEGGELYCESSSGGERIPYDSCEIFSQLRDQGCFGYSTYDMSMEMRYESMCSKKSALVTARDSQENYFAFESADWWKPLPAAVIPMSGGVYSGESWEIASSRREELVADKQLGDLPFSEIESSNGRFAATLEITNLECGEIRNRLEMEAAQTLESRC
jgi:hypothetical protein